MSDAEEAPRGDGEDLPVLEADGAQEEHREKQRQDWSQIKEKMKRDSLEMKADQKK